MNPHHNFLLFTDGVSYSDHISRKGKPPEERALLATKKKVLKKLLLDELIIRFRMIYSLASQSYGSLLE